jgi:hypothetical protein
MVLSLTKELRINQLIIKSLFYYYLSLDLLVLPLSACYSAVAGNVDEAKKLIEAGYEYVWSYENVILF